MADKWSSIMVSIPSAFNCFQKVRNVSRDQKIVPGLIRSGSRSRFLRCFSNSLLGSVSVAPANWAQKIGMMSRLSWSAETNAVAFPSKIRSKQKFEAS